MGRWLYLLLLGGLGALFIRACLVEGIVVATGSMEPTLPVGHHAFVNKMIYRFQSPERGDIIVFPSPVDEKEMVKRVIAVEEDVVEIRNKRVLVNDQWLQEPYIQHTRPDELLKGDNIPPFRVPKNHVFVLGDNRDQSGDSRDWIDPDSGKHVYFVSKRMIEGRLIGVK